MNRSMPNCLYRLGAAGLIFSVLGGCSILDASKEPPPAYYALNGTRSGTTATPSAAAPTVIVNLPHAAAGFDSQHIVYVREPHRLEYFANSEWADTPARMIAPLIVAALENTGAFRAVILTPSAATGEMRLEVDIVQLQHEFVSTPSQVRFVLRAWLVDTGTRRVLARREFEAVVAASQDTPYAGIVAANAAVRSVLDDLAAFCAAAADKGRLANAAREKVVY